MMYYGEKMAIICKSDESLKEGQVPVQAQVVATTATPVLYQFLLNVKYYK